MVFGGYSQAIVVLLAAVAMACLGGEAHFVQVQAEGIPADCEVHAVQWLDYDRDGKPDLMLAGHLYRNVSENGVFRFEDRTEPSGVKGAGPRLCYDYDNDGWCDIVIAGTEAHVWHNKGDGTFEDKAKELGFSPGERAMTLNAGDVDGDGFPDLFIGKGEIWEEKENGSTFFPAELWMNHGDKWTEEAAVRKMNRKTYARAVLMADLNGDGLADIFVGNYRLQANLLWMSQPNGSFSEQGKQAGVAGKYNPNAFYDKTARRTFGPSHGHTIGACWTDYDNDGKIDIFTANLAHKYVGKSPRGKNYDYRGYICGDSEILHNLGNGKFADGREQLRLPTKPIGDKEVFKGDELWGGCAPGDVDNDGWEDIFVPQIYKLPYSSSLLLMNQEGRRFVNQSQTAGLVRFDTFSGAWADIDGDGALDMLVGGRPAAADAPKMAFYRNVGASKNAWLKVRLYSGKGGTALGAVVSVKPDVGASQMRINGGATSTLSQQNDPALHFGLGVAVKATVTVRWLDGTTEVREADAGTVLEFTREKGSI